MEALNGSCLQIPCSFIQISGSPFDAQKPSVGLWIKNDPRFKLFPDNVIFNSSRKDNVYPMSLIGDLRKKNCTTVFSNLSKRYIDIYFFRVENHDFLATASCSEIRIDVRGKSSCSFGPGLLLKSRFGGIYLL